MPGYKFKLGDRVKVVEETHGWGNVRLGDIGTVVLVTSRTLDIRMDKGHPHTDTWTGFLNCFEPTTMCPYCGHCTTASIKPNFIINKEDTP